MKCPTCRIKMRCTNTRQLTDNLRWRRWQCLNCGAFGDTKELLKIEGKIKIPGRFKRDIEKGIMDLQGTLQRRGGDLNEF